jgi:glycogen(starch) synthase
VTDALRVLVVTDSFPPRCGGSGWSTWELVRGLRHAGHHVDVVHVKPRHGAEDVVTVEYQQTPVTVFHINAPTTPFVRNYFKNERLWRRLSAYLEARVQQSPVDVIHAQHVWSTLPAVAAGQARAIPVVATVRDYWPVCYWSDLIYDPGQPQLCPACSAGMMARCLRPRAGVATPLAWPLIPYMRANLRTKRRGLAAATAVIAVSSVIARDLVRRAPELDSKRVHTIPNPFDMAALDHVFDAATPLGDGPYVLYVGKLATNKGVQFLIPALAAARVEWPLVVVGDGPLRGALETEARTHGVNLRVLGWRDRDEVWRWMRHATMLAFPSYGPESLSRVLIEAAALGVPTAAMDTGGTSDIIQAGTTGLLADGPDAFARDLDRLAHDASLRARLGAAARRGAHDRFDSTAVVARIERVYRQVLRSNAD